MICHSIETSELHLSSCINKSDFFEGETNDWITCVGEIKFTVERT